jgi:hypothetical protein
MGYSCKYKSLAIIVDDYFWLHLPFSYGIFLKIIQEIAAASKARNSMGENKYRSYALKRDTSISF